jgi:hypothetical protein
MPRLAVLLLLAELLLMLSLLLAKLLPGLQLMRRFSNVWRFVKNPSVLYVKALIH